MVDFSLDLSLITIYLVMLSYLVFTVGSIIKSKAAICKTKFYNCQKSINILIFTSISFAFLALLLLMGSPLEICVEGFSVLSKHFLKMGKVCFSFFLISAFSLFCVCFVDGQSSSKKLIKHIISYQIILGIIFMTTSFILNIQA